MNLTEHQVVLDAFEPAAPGQDPGAMTPSAVRLLPEGRPARVGDDRARLGQGWLNADAGLVRLTRLRRSSDLVDLPHPEPGTRYVVSRVTALAARRRGDLVFPFGERTDLAGRVTRVSGLATFQPGWAPRQWYRDRRAAARGRRARKPLGSQALTGVLFAMATALLSGALALLPGAADNAQQNGWAGGGQFWASWLTVGFGVAGLAVLGGAAWRWRRRAVILDERGTAYVIEELAIAWRHEEKESVLAAIGKGFASTLRVPGPGALGDNWRWQVDAEGAARWDERTDQLVRSFWAVHYNDDQVTRNALFTWAPWPVAMAFGARATARRRGLVLHVRQRPSYGAADPRQQLSLTEPAHEFLRDKRPTPLEQAAPEHRVEHLQGHLAVTVEPLGLPNAAAAHPCHPARAASRGGPPRQDAAGRMLLLLVRVTHGPIGPIAMTLAHTPAVTAHVSRGLAGSLIPVGTHTVAAAEWRLDSKAQPVPQLPWDAFPAAAESITEWVVERASAHPGHVILLATRIPQELAVGLGIQLGQRAHAWPQHVYPVYFVSERLVVPELMLGAESVPAERA